MSVLQKADCQKEESEIACFLTGPTTRNCKRKAQDGGEVPGSAGSGSAEVPGTHVCGDLCGTCVLIVCVFCVLLCEDILIASLADLSLVVVLLVLPQAHAQALHVSQVCDVCARLRACGVCATKVM